MDELVVTGSFIPVAADEIAIPVSRIDTEMIDNAAVATNAFDVLRKAVPQFTGNANIGADNANIGSGSTGGGSQASLRNLTTLTLINGRRAAVSPISGTGGYQFVDLNIIPLAAIDSIEVLLDGASATYGSDATSGVINIKTRQNYRGTQVSGFYEIDDAKNNWENRGANFIFGIGNEKTNLTIAGGWSKKDPLFQYQRQFSNPSYGTPTYGGVINLGSNYFVLNPAYDAPPVGTTKPTLAFPMTTVPTAPDGKPYFGTVGSNAVYWGKTNSGGAIVGFSSGELAGATTPAAEQVAFNLARYVTLMQQRESKGAIMSIDHQLNENVQLFGEVLASSIKTVSQINAQPAGISGFGSWHPYNPFNNTVTVRNRFVTNPRQYRYDTEFIRGIAGARGSYGDRVKWETALNLNRSKLDYRNPGVLDAETLYSATGRLPAQTSASAIKINHFQRNVDPQAVEDAGFVGVGTNSFKSTLYSWDGRAVIDAFNMPAGTAVVAVGGEYRREALSGTADERSIPDVDGNIGWLGATSVNPFDASRNVTGAFVEARFPLASPNQNIKAAYKAEIDVAVRHEIYSDTTDPTVPKFTFKWHPFNDEFAVRGTWSKSFNAPTLYNLFGSSDVGFTVPLVLLPYGEDPNDEDAYVNGQANLKGGSNPALKPATSKAATFGVVYSPKGLKGFSTEITYWRIKEKDIVGVISAQSILQSVEDLGDKSPYVRKLANGQPNPDYIGDPNNPVSYDVVLSPNLTWAETELITGPGQVAGNLDYVYLTRPLMNIASQKASGLDFKVQYRWEQGTWGSFNFLTNVAYWLKYEFDGYRIDNAATSTGGTIPRWSSYSSLEWKRKQWGVAAGMQFIPEVPTPEESASGITEMGDRAYLDIGVSYEFDDSVVKFLDGLKLTFVVKNLTNKLPPLAPDTFSESNADHGTYSPMGRMFLVRASYDF